jgi:hypothetical protein
MYSCLILHDVYLFEKMEDHLKGCHFMYRLKVSVPSKTVKHLSTNSGIILQLMATVSKVFLVLALSSYVPVLRNFISYHV